MGICGFHQYTKHYLEEKHIRSYANKRVGIDASAWLHRGAVPYAWDICNGTEPWKQYGNAQPPWVEFPMRLFHMLVSFDVHPVFVFDGCPSPAKAPTSLVRRTRKDKARQRALESLRMGNQAEAARLMQQAFDVTHDMAGDLISELQSRSIEFIVAPYEADAQLAYLASIPTEEGGVDAVITEDSDLVAYGCKSILFKCSTEGVVQQLRKERLLGPSDPILEKTCLELKGHKDAVALTYKMKSKYVFFDDWSDEQMCLLCILAGCDFLPSLKGMGFKTAYAMVKKGRTIDNTLSMMKKHPRWAEMMTDEYAQHVKKAYETFRYSLVYDQKLSRAVHLRKLPEHLQDKEGDALSHLGPRMEPEIIQQIALGTINPISRKQYQKSTQKHNCEAWKQPRNIKGIFAHVFSQKSETAKISNQICGGSVGINNADLKEPVGYDTRTTVQVVDTVVSASTQAETAEAEKTSFASSFSFFFASKQSTNHRNGIGKNLRGREGVEKKLKGGGGSSSSHSQSQQSNKKMKQSQSKTIKDFFITK